MNPNLVPKQITGKNGVTKTYWVKSDSDASTGKSMPQPARALSPVAQAKRLAAEIKSGMHDEDRHLGDYVWGHNDFGHLRYLVQTGNVEALTAVKNTLMPLDPEFAPGTIGLFTQQLQLHGVEQPSILITRENITHSNSIRAAIKEYGTNSASNNIYLDESEESEALYLMGFTDPGLTEEIIELVRERGVLSPDEVRVLVEERKKSIPVLREGVL